MKHGIFFRVFAGYVIVSLLAVLIFSFYTLRLVRSISYDALKQGLESAALAAKVPTEPLLAAGRSEALDNLVARLGREGRVRITVIDAKGVVLADSLENAATMENHSQRPEVAEALKGATGVSYRLSSTINRWMVYVAVPVSGPQGLRGVVRAAAFPEELNAAVLRERGGLFLFASILFGACLLALLFSRTLVAPLRDLAGVVEKFAAGDFGARLHLRRHDEIKGLADSFNIMGERVQTQFGEGSQRAQELDGIFSSVQQGILLVDSHGRIVRCNRGFEDLVGARAAEGRTLWELARAPRLTELVQRARDTGARQSEEVAFGDKSVLCTVERMSGRQELIVVLQDTSDVRQLETVKRDFVVNASHELRTPLTSILGSLEMLEGEVKGDGARWVDTIKRNAGRMTAIVEDLLSLAQLETHGVEPAAEPVDLARLLDDVKLMFQHRAESEGIILETSLAPGMPPLVADPFLLEQMLVNLVDNALKYTETGSVRLLAESEADHVRIEVIDTGIGIPEDSLSRIFERFYVVDKSRSRKLGGTGLGLSIVKHIVQSHSGTIEVQSQLGKGTHFIVRIPFQRGPRN